MVKTTDPSQMTPEEITRAYAVEVCGLQVNAPTKLLPFESYTLPRGRILTGAFNPLGSDSYCFLGVDAMVARGWRFVLMLAQDGNWVSLFVKDETETGWMKADPDRRLAIMDAAIEAARSEK